MRVRRPSTWRAPPWPYPSARTALFEAKPKLRLCARQPLSSASAATSPNTSANGAAFPLSTFPSRCSIRRPYPDLGRFENEFVTLVNPCAVKGISIFLALADCLPLVKFLAVPTWGTNDADRAALATRPNVTVIDPVDNVDEILRRTRVLLVPSLWAEARSRIVVEAMLRGVPVLASNIGGIPEAKLGVDYLLPVQPIESYQARVDEQMVPVADVPLQDIEPWQTALETLLSNRAHYQALSRASRQKALAYAGELSAGPFEALLQQVFQQVPKPAATRAATAGAPSESALDRLSPDRRKLLALRLRKMSGTWFPGADSVSPGSLRLFCFPHAGGGASAFHGWGDRLPPSIAVLPARPPRREHLLELVETLADALEPYTDDPFAFFGHSMGAVVAFELARLLRRREQPLPQILVVSGARAPQYRRGHVPPPEPPLSEFIDELRRLEGVPAQVLDDPALLRMVLPALRADTALYRNYVYREEPPLDCPICAYGGTEDPNIRREHLEAWAQQTTSTFHLRMFPGGHFFPQTARESFIESLTKDLSAV